MSDEEEDARFSPTQMAVAGIVCAVVLIVVVMAMMIWRSMAG